jgi:hypothetical protein
MTMASFTIEIKIFDFSTQLRWHPSGKSGIVVLLVTQGIGYYIRFAGMIIDS